MQNVAARRHYCSHEIKAGARPLCKQPEERDPIPRVIANLTEHSGAPVCVGQRDILKALNYLGEDVGKLDECVKNDMKGNHNYNNVTVGRRDEGQTYVLRRPT